MVDQSFEADLERLSRLLALGLVIGRKQADQILLLSKAGFDPKGIAELIGTTPNTVRVALSKMRKENKFKIPTKTDTRTERF